MLDARLLESDPRRDGYAQKLQAFFVNERTRRFFVPFSNWKNKSVSAIEDAVRDALSGIPVSSIVVHNPRPTLHNSRLPFLPPLSRTFGIIGRAAVWAALFMTCGLFIPAFFKNFLSSRAYRLSGHHRNTRLAKTPVVMSLLLAALFAAGGIVFVSRFPVNVSPINVSPINIFLISVFLVALFLLAWTLPVWLRWKAAARRGHILFRPVAIRESKPRSEKRRPPVVILCLFAAGAVACAVSFFTGLEAGDGAAGFSNEGYGGLVSEEEYYAHSLRQTTFAYLPLGVDREEDAPPYRRYAEGPDGLYAAAGAVEIMAEAEESVVPAYPFDSLAAFIEGTDGGQGAVPAPQAAGWPDSVLLFFIALAALLPFALPNFHNEFNC